MKKKLLLLFIALIAVSLTIFVACDSGYDCSAGIHNYTVENKCALCGEEWKYSEGLEFELSDDGTYYYVEGIGTCTDTEIVIPYGYNGKPVTSIGSAAFVYCEELTNITIPDSVTSIGGYAFSYCRKLTSITIPNSVTSIGENAFSDTGYYNDSSNWENSALYIGKYLIAANPSILGNYTVKDGTLCIGPAAFEGCTKLTSITIPNSVTSIGPAAFEGCTKLTSVTIPNSVTSIGKDAFWGCTGLMSVTIPNSVKSIGSAAFYNCKGLTSVTIPDSVTSIGDEAFDGCYKLVEVINKSNLTITAGSLSCGKVGLYAFSVHKGDTSHIVDKDGYLFYTHSGVNYLLGYKGTDTALTLPSDYNGQNYQIYQYAFDNCDELTSVTIGNSVTSIGYMAFYNCTELTSITIPNSVTSIGSYAFCNCTGLASVTIPDSVTSIGSYAFEDCTGLTSIKYRDTKAHWDAISKGSRWNEYYYNSSYYKLNYTMTYNYTGE